MSQPLKSIQLYCLIKGLRPRLLRLTFKLIRKKFHRILPILENNGVQTPEVLTRVLFPVLLPLVDDQVPHRCHKCLKLVNVNGGLGTRKDSLPDVRPLGEMQISNELSLSTLLNSSHEKSG